MNRFANLMAGAAWSPASLCSIEDGAGGDAGAGGGGGAAGAGAAAGGAAAALAGGGAAGAAGAGAGAGAAAGADGGAGAAAGAGGDAGGGADPAFLELFSAEGGDADNPSARDYIKGLGVKDPNHLAQLLRDNQKAARAGGIKVPGEGAKPEEIAAYHKAIGVPEKVEGYEFAMPEGVTEDMLDMNLIPKVREAALAAGAPAAGFTGMAEAVIAAQLDQMQADRTAEDADYQAKVKEWGGQSDAKMADVQNAMRTLGITPQEFQAMQRGYQIEFRAPGSGKLLDLFAKIGGGMSEATFLDGGKGRFGISGAEARREKDALIADVEFGKKYAAGDPTAVARMSRLTAAIAADIDRQNAADGRTA
jgi:hypothetical protein